MVEEVLHLAAGDGPPAPVAALSCPARSSARSCRVAGPAWGRSVASTGSDRAAPGRQNAAHRALVDRAALLAPDLRDHAAGHVAPVVEAAVVALRWPRCRAAPPRTPRCRRASRARPGRRSWPWCSSADLPGLVGLAVRHVLPRPHVGDVGRDRFELADRERLEVEQQQVREDEQDAARVGDLQRRAPRRAARSSPRGPGAVRSCSASPKRGSQIMPIRPPCPVSTSMPWPLPRSYAYWSSSVTAKPVSRR